MRQKLDDKQRALLVTRLEVLQFRRNDFLVQMGDPADSLYFIKTGEVTCHQGGQELLRLGES